VKRVGSPGLFWRTFLLILLLLAASTLAWLQSFRVFEREPRAQQLAQQMISIVNITRSALLYSPTTRASASSRWKPRTGSGTSPTCR
jgi:hypothetical protein